MKKTMGKWMVLLLGCLLLLCFATAAMACGGNGNGNGNGNGGCSSCGEGCGDSGDCCGDLVCFGDTCCDSCPDCSDCESCVCDGCCGGCHCEDNCGEGERCSGGKCVPSDDGDDTGKNDSEGAEPVSLTDGEYYFSSRDLLVRGRGLSVKIVRTYASQYDYNWGFGHGWDMNYNLKALKTSDPDIMILLDGEGHGLNYSRVAGSNPPKYTAPPGRYDYIIENQNSTYTLHKKHGTKWEFDTDGRLSVITDRNGNNINFAYGSGDPNKLTTITDDLGRGINLAYSDGLLAEVNDFSGRSWTYSYNDGNDLLAVTGPNTPEYPSGLTWEYTYSAHNLLTAKDANGQTYLTNTYSADKITEQAYGDGTYKISYNPGSNEATVTDRRDFNSVTVYNETGNPLSITIYTNGLRPGDPCSYTASYQYNSDMEITKEIFPAGNYTDYTYDANGNVLTIAREPNNGEPNIVTTYTYESNFNFVKTRTDPLGDVTSYDYNDTNGNLIKITYPEVDTPDGPEQPTVSFTYNGYGQVETATVPDGMVIKCEYYSDGDPNDPNCGRLWKVIVDYNETDGLNITTEYKYNILGRVIEVNDPNGDITHFTHNNLDELMKVTAPSPFNYVTLLSYNKNKKLSQIERVRANDPNQIIKYAYDILDHLKRVTDPLGYVTKYSRDKSENLSDVNDAELNNTNYTYDERDLLWKLTDANGGVTEYSYTLNGKLKEIKDANGGVTGYDYDGFDRLICITYPNDTNEVFGYDKAGNVTGKKNRKDETIYYQYDALDRMTVKNRPSDPNIYCRYDIAGRLYDVNDLRDVNDGGGLTSYSYDRIGRVSEVNDIESKLVKYEYDSRGLRTKLTWPDGSYITYEYDELSRLRRIKDDSSNILAEYTYDELSRRTLLTLGNDANAVYEYDLGNRLEKLTNNLDDSNSIVFDYNNYDNVGNRLSCKIDDANTQVYTYDNLYQLIYVDYNDGNTTNYYYDSRGNRTKVTDGITIDYTSNMLNQYTCVGERDFSYDDNGNLTDGGIVFGMQRFFYDCENRLFKVEMGQYIDAEYKYDYAGRRVKKTTYIGPYVDTITKFCYDGDRVIAEYDVNDTLLRKFVYGPGIDEPILMIDVADGNKIYYYHFDGLGSVAALSDVNSVVVERYEYKVFGYDTFGKQTIRDANGTIIDESQVGNPYMFTGRRYDGETGLYYYRARYYAPQIGRFMQTDPVALFLQVVSTRRFVREKIPGTYLSAPAVEEFLLNDPIGRFLRVDPAGRFLQINQSGFPVELNLYTYCGNNPMIFVDPYGLDKYRPWWVTPVEKIGDAAGWLHNRLNIRKRIREAQKDYKKGVDIAGEDPERAMELWRRGFGKGCEMGADLIRVTPGTTVRPRPTPYRR